MKWGSIERTMLSLKHLLKWYQNQPNAWAAVQAVDYLLYVADSFQKNRKELIAMHSLLQRCFRSRAELPSKGPQYKVYCTVVIILLHSMQGSCMYYIRALYVLFDGPPSLLCDFIGLSTTSSLLMPVIFFLFLVNL